MLVVAILTVTTAVVVCVGLHLATLVILSRTLDRWFKRAHWAIGVLVLIAIVAHLFEISIFTVGIRLLEYWHDGTLHHDPEVRFAAWFTSASAYTSLGIEPPKLLSVRLLVAVEALTGLILITWTASFLFLVMQRSWDSDRIRKTK